MSGWIFPFAFGLAFVVVYFTTPVIMRWARVHKITASSRFAAGGNEAIPLLGGLAIFFGWSVAVIIIWAIFKITGNILTKHIIGILIGGGWLMIGGYLDDKYNLPPRQQLIWPFLAVLSVVISGIGINYITNPLSPEKLIYLNSFSFDLFWWQGIPYRFTVLADIFTLAWLYIIMYATKLQDGLDGLVSGISFIGSVFIFLLSWFLLRQMDLALLIISFSGALLAFWFYNKYPAKIFLGEGGSLFLGYVLGVAAIVSDAKVIVTLIILALPIIDAGWAIIRRLKNNRLPWQGDQEHLHHKLVKSGLSHQKTVAILYLATLVFGVLVLIWQSSLAYYFSGLLILVTVISAFIFAYAYLLSGRS